ncbi:MAG TPA: thioredoxin family protein [Terriglobales bacterium]|nr:thioredoxin family protein [Terriglobales bacterium]
MKRSLATIITALALTALSFAAVKPGDAAPDFTAVDSNGRTHKLSDFKGKYVVLEWTNQGCPYTVKHYASGNMQKLQKEWTGKGVVWLTVLSSAPGQQGHVSAQEENAYLKKQNASPTAALIDEKGTVGKLYGAKTTPHMYIIDPQGKLIYAGAIDNKPTTDQSDVSSAKNYVSAALTEAMSGKPVTTASTSPYGCSVKYAN